MWVANILLFYTVFESTQVTPKTAFIALDTGAVWRADTLAQAPGVVVDTGHRQLSEHLPGGGWPLGALIEVLQQPGQHLEWQLILPALAALPRGQPGGREPVVVLVGPPHHPFGPGLAGRGLQPQALLSVDTQTPLECLWATEQALQCADVSAVLAWLPQARSDQLRRLQMAASQHQCLLFVMRPAQVRTQASPAVLRLEVLNSPARVYQRGLKILKRRGPPLAQDLHIPAMPARLTALQQVSCHALDRFSAAS